MSEKVTGYVLLFAGLAIMVFAFYQVYLVFTNNAKPIKLFSGNPLTNNLLQQSAPSIRSPQEGMTIPMPQIQVVPQETLNEALDTIAYYFLMSFVMGFGFKVSLIGVQLLRPIEVKLKTKEVESPKTSPEKP